MKKILHATDILAMKNKAAHEVLSDLQHIDYVAFGTGSTINCLIHIIGKLGMQFRTIIASSTATSKLLKNYDYTISDINDAGSPDIYIDGTDAFDVYKNLIKGQGAALTQEKICATASKKFICIADSSKYYKHGIKDIVIPLEVLPCARSCVARQIVAQFKAQPELRTGVVTDQNNIILDIHHLTIQDYAQMEILLNSLPGVVDNGIFALRKPEKIIMGNLEEKPIIFL